MLELHYNVTHCGAEFNILSSSLELNSRASPLESLEKLFIIRIWLTIETEPKKAATKKCLFKEAGNQHFTSAIILISVYKTQTLCHCPYNKWHPTPVLLPGKSQGRRSLVGCSPWGHRRVGHDWATSLSLFTFMHWRRKWQPTPVFLPGESQGQGSLVGCRLWGRTD